MTSVMTAPPTRHAIWAPPTASAVVWVDETEAIVAVANHTGHIDVTGILCPVSGPDARTWYIRRIVARIGRRDRVLILGPDRARLDVEREYVFQFGRPDRLIDVEPADAMERHEVVKRLHELAA